jgi:hypothetical protein
MKIDKILLVILTCTHGFITTQRPYLIYSPGFGGKHKHESTAQFYCKKFFIEDNDFSIVRYADAAGRLHNAHFYTQPAVHTLARAFYNKIITQQHNSVILVGFSCGAATIINCLAELCNNAHAQEKYSEKTLPITTQDTRSILSALNQGALVLSAPLLDMRTVKAIQRTATLFEISSIAGICAALSRIISPSMHHMPPLIKKYGVTALAIGMHCAIGRYLKNYFMHPIIYTFLPHITNYQFNPLHPTPRENSAKLKGKLTCPILLHFHAHDGVLENPAEDIVQLYDAIKNDTTHIIITTDGHHKKGSRQFSEALTVFQKHYFPKNGDTLLSDEEWKFWCKKTQPTSTQLGEQLNKIC